MTPEQEAFLRDLPHFEVIDPAANGALLVKGVDGLYILNTSGTLKPVKEGR